MSLSDKHLVVIAGPTASGKTSVGIQLARHFDTEIISADSRQIYRESSIGTAVPDQEELKLAKHHFIQTYSLGTYYNASLFEQEVLELLKELFSQHHIVLMVGGSGLYLDAVCKGIDELPSVNHEIRETLADEYKRKGLLFLQEKLKELDPVTYEKVDLNNHLRILKALEICIQTGKPYSQFLTHRAKKRDFNIIRIALDVEREKLYNRINSRVDEMVKNGLVSEVMRLREYRKCNAMKTVGYKEIFEYLDGKTGLEEAIQKIKNNTRKYARKQITWFRKNNEYTWMNPEDLTSIITYIENTASEYR